jgi:hypothetical protein
MRKTLATITTPDPEWAHLGMEDIRLIGLECEPPFSASDPLIPANQREPCQPGKVVDDGSCADNELAQRLRFGQALKCARIQLGIPSQAALSRATGIDTASICRFEGGIRLPSLLQFAVLTLCGLDAVALLAALDGQ